MKIPVLFLIEHLSDGGSEQNLFDVASNIDRERFEVHVMFFEPGLMSERLATVPHVKITRFPALRRTFSFTFFKICWLLLRYIQDNGIRVVMTFHFLADLIGTVTALFHPGMAVVSNRRDMGFTRSRMQKFVIRLLGFRINKYVAVSEAVKCSLTAQESVPPYKIQVIYNGTDFYDLMQKRWDPEVERRAAGIAESDLIIGCVANFNPVKGHGTLIKAFGLLCAQQPEKPLRLLLAGEGQMLANIRTEVASRKLEENVSFVGFSPNPGREFQMSDIVVSPSDTEGFSNTIVQAMAFAKPIVATAVGGTPEAITDGKTGLLVPPNEPEALAMALQRLVVDPDLRQRFGAQAKVEALARFGRPRMMERVQELLACWS